MKKKNNYALVCGGSYGLGSEIVRYFISKNINTVVFARNKKKLNTFVKKFKSKKIIGLKCDLSNPKDVKKNIQILKKKKYIINYLICNAGNGKNDFSQKKNNLNFYSAYFKNFFTSINPIELLINSGNFENLKIIVISSIAGHFRGGAPLPYSLAKNSLINYCKENSKNFASKNIFINSISPGHIMQTNNLWHKKLKKNKSKTLSFIKKNVALKKFCTTDDIIHTIHFLLSENNRYITGIDIKVDGSSN